MADTGELVAYAKTLPDLFVSVLVPNLKGAEKAIGSGADLMLVLALGQSGPQTMEKQNNVIHPSSPEEAVKFSTSELDRYAGLVKRADIKID